LTSAHRLASLYRKHLTPEARIGCVPSLHVEVEVQDGKSNWTAFDR
jgi:hypothetical protein